MGCNVSSRAGRKAQNELLSNRNTGVCTEHVSGAAEFPLVNQTYFCDSGSPPRDLSHAPGGIVVEVGERSRSSQFFHNRSPLRSALTRFLARYAAVPLKQQTETGNAWQSPAVARQAHRTHYAGRRRHPSPAIDSSRLLLARRYLQRGRSIPSILRGCSECTARFLFLVTLIFDI